MMFKKIIKNSYFPSILCILVYVLPMCIFPSDGIGENIRDSNIIKSLEIYLIYTFSFFYLLSFNKKIDYFKTKNLDGLYNGCYYFFAIIIIEIISVGYTILMVSSPDKSMSGEIPPPDLVFKLILFTFFHAFYEELIFRGIFIKSAFSKYSFSKKGIYMATVFPSILFGFAHVLTIDLFINPTAVQFIQATLKVIQTYILGYFFCSQALKVRSILWSTFLHFLFNFFPILSSIILYPETASNFTTQYITVNENSLIVIYSYITVILFELPLYFSAKKTLKATFSNLN